MFHYKHLSTFLQLSGHWTQYKRIFTNNSTVWFSKFVRTKGTNTFIINIIVHLFIYTYLYKLSTHIEVLFSISCLLLFQVTALKVLEMFDCRWIAYRSLVEHELLTRLEHMSSSSVFSGFRVTRPLVFCVVFCRWLFFLFSFGRFVVLYSQIFAPTVQRS